MFFCFIFFSFQFVCLVVTDRGASSGVPGPAYPRSHPRHSRDRSGIDDRGSTREGYRQLTISQELLVQRVRVPTIYRPRLQIEFPTWCYASLLRKTLGDIFHIAGVSVRVTYSCLVPRWTEM